MKTRATIAAFESRDTIVIAITCDNRYIVSASKNRPIKIWNIKKKSLKRSLPGHINRVTCIAISNDRRYIVSGSADCTVRIWNTHEKIQEAVLAGHCDTVSCLAITENNKFIFSGSYDRTVRIWRPPGGRKWKTRRTVAN